MNGALRHRITRGEDVLRCSPRPLPRTELIAIAGDAGSLQGCTISVESDGGAGVRWEVFDGDKLPQGLAPRVLHIKAYEAMLHGQLDGEAILYAGRRYALADAWQDGRLVAVLTEIGTPA